MANLKLAALAIIASGTVQAKGNSGRPSKSSEVRRHFRSSAFVSPAQIYQVKTAKTDFAITAGASQKTEKPVGQTELSTNATDTRFFAGGVYNLVENNTRVGIFFDLGNFSSEQENTETGEPSQAKITGTQSVLSPRIAYPLKQFYLAAGIDAITRDSGFEGENSSNLTYVKFNPAVLYVTRDIEAGISGMTSYKKSAGPGETGTGVGDPGHALIHGMYLLSKGFRVGGVAENRAWSSIDKDNYLDQFRIKGQARYAYGKTEIEATLGFNSSYHKVSGAMTADTIGTTEVETGADYHLSSASSIGGNLKYGFGNDVSKRDGEFDVKTFELGFRGDIQF